MISSRSLSQQVAELASEAGSDLSLKCWVTRLKVSLPTAHRAGGEGLVSRQWQFPFF